LLAVQLASAKAERVGPEERVLSRFAQPVSVPTLAQVLGPVMRQIDDLLS